MSDYNDGKWWGWNGGECPVHPETVVDTVTKNYGLTSGHKASLFGWWVDHINPIIAFRVVTQYVEPKKPREFWARQTEIFGTPKYGSSILFLECEENDEDSIKFREVLE
jgi:hypothetical protein